MAKSKDKSKASTQEHLDVEDIVENLVVLKTGWVAMVLQTSAVNFDILSEAEQDATMYAYGALLNSLTFPLQTLIRSKRQDISAYYQHLTEAEQSQQNPDLKRQIQKYRDFIQSTVQQRTLLDKKFYLVIHFSPLELSVRSFKKHNAQNIKSKAQLVSDAKVALAPKRDHIIKQTARLGLITRQLETQELVELFYDIYNPAPTGTQRVLLDSASYTVPLVEPDLETPTPKPAEAAVQPIIDVSTPQAVAQVGQLPEQTLSPEPVISANDAPAVAAPGSEDALKTLQEATRRAAEMGKGVSSS